jgi:hypothetical protein
MRERERREKLGDFEILNLKEVKRDTERERERVNVCMCVCVCAFVLSILRKEK